MTSFCAKVRCIELSPLLHRAVVCFVLLCVLIPATPVAVFAQEVAPADTTLLTPELQKLAEVKPELTETYSAQRTAALDGLKAEADSWQEQRLLSKVADNPVEDLGSTAATQSIITTLKAQGAIATLSTDAGGETEVNPALTDGFFGGTFTTENTPYQASIPTSAADPLIITEKADTGGAVLTSDTNKEVAKDTTPDTAEEIRYLPRHTSDHAVTVHEDNKIIYKNHWDNTDLLRTTTDTGVKEDIILKNTHSKTTFEYLVETVGLTLHLTSDGVLEFRDADGNTKFEAPAPDITDATGKKVTTGVHYRLGWSVQKDEAQSTKDEGQEAKDTQQTEATHSPDAIIPTTPVSTSVIPTEVEGSLTSPSSTTPASDSSAPISQGSDSGRNDNGIIPTPAPEAPATTAPDVFESAGDPAPTPATPSPAPSESPTSFLRIIKNWFARAFDAVPFAIAQDAEQLIAPTAVIPTEVSAANETEEALTTASDSSVSSTQGASSTSTATTDFFAPEQGTGSSAQDSNTESGQSQNIGVSGGASDAASEHVQTTPAEQAFFAPSTPVVPTPAPVIPTAVEGSLDSAKAPLGMTNSVCVDGDAATIRDCFTKSTLITLETKADNKPTIYRYKLSLVIDVQADENVQHVQSDTSSTSETIEQAQRSNDENTLILTDGTTLTFPLDLDPSTFLRLTDRGSRTFAPDFSQGTINSSAGQVNGEGRLNRGTEAVQTGGTNVVASNVAITALDAAGDNFRGSTSAYTADANTQLLLHLDNNVTDSEATPKTITNSNVTFSSSPAKLGGYSASFNGTNASLTTPASADFNFGTGDFTVDGWMYLNSGSTYYPFVGSVNYAGRNSTNGTWSSFIDTSASRFKIYTYDAGATNVEGTTFPSTWSYNTWYHIAIVRSGTQVSVYQNGNSLGSLTVNKALTDNTLEIGYQTHNAYKLSGYLDELRISKGLARWTSSFTPAPITDSQDWLTIGTSLRTNKIGAKAKYTTATASEIWAGLTYSPAGGIVKATVDKGTGSEVVNYIDTYSSTTQSQQKTLIATGLPNTTHTVELELTPRRSTKVSDNDGSKTANGVSTSGLVAYYPMDSNWNDASGNGNNPTNGANLPTSVGGRFGNAASFASSARLLLPNLGAGVSAAAPRSISLWFKKTDYTNGVLYISGFTNTSQLFGITAYGQGLYISGYANDVQTSGTVYPLNQWNHLVVTYSGNAAMTPTTTQVYLNGILQPLVQASGPNGNLNTWNQSYALGYYPDFPASNPFTGLLDDVAIYNRVLTSSEVQQFVGAQRLTFDYLETYPAGSELASTSTTGTVSATGNTTTTLGTALTASSTDSYKGYALTFTSGTHNGKTVYVTGNTNGANTTITFTPALSVAPATSDTFALTPDGININGRATRGLRLNATTAPGGAEFDISNNLPTDSSGLSSKGSWSSWVKPDFAYNADTQRHFIYDTGIQRLYYDGSDSKFHFQVLSETSDWSSSPEVTSATQSFTVETSIHLATTWNATTGLKLFVNGVKTSTTANWTAQVVNTSINTMKIGATTPQSTAQRWKQETAAASFTGRLGHTSVIFNNKLWVIGGNNGGTYYNDVWSSPDGVTWTQATANAGWQLRSYQASVVFNNKMWVIGGLSAGNCNGTGKNECQDVWSSPDGVTWTQATASAAFTQRAYHTAWVYNNKMWVAGGYTGFGGTTRFNDVWSSTDGVTWTQSTAAAAWSGRNGLFSTVFNSKMWIVGGYANAGYADDAWSSTDGVTWTQTASSQFSVSALFAPLVFDNRIYLVGTKGIWSSADGSSWLRVASDGGFPSRSSASTLVWNNKMFLIAGSTRNDVWSTSFDHFSGTIAEPQLFDYVLTDTEALNLSLSSTPSVSQNVNQKIEETRRGRKALLFNAPMVETPGDRVATLAGTAKLSATQTGTVTAINTAALGGAGKQWSVYDHSVAGLDINTDPNATKWNSTRTYSPSVIKDGSIYKMWFEGVDGSNVDRILYAESVDGKAWTTFDHTVAGIDINTDPNATKWNSNFNTAPSVIKDGAIYKMWFTGGNGSNQRILYAESTDGKSWTVADHATAGIDINTDPNATKWNSSNSYYPSVIKDGAIYKMWFTGSDGTNQRILYAESADGKSWTVADHATAGININTDQNTTKWNSVRSIAPTVTKDGALYKMWFAGFDGSNYRQLYAESTDGKSWTVADHATAGIDINTDPNATKWNSTHTSWPAVMKDGSTYKAWLTSYGANGYYSLLYAESTDINQGSYTTTTAAATTSIVAGFDIGPTGGIARVTVDEGTGNELVTDIDTYNASVATKQRFLVATGLPSGTHTVRIESSGVANTANTSGLAVVTPRFIETNATDAAASASLTVNNRLVDSVITQDYATLPNAVTFSSKGNISDKTNEGTIETWVQTPWAGNDGVVHNVIDTRDATPRNGIVMWKNSDNTLMARFWNASTWITLASSTLTVSDWAASTSHHIALRWWQPTSSTMGLSIYLDGKKIAENKSQSFTPTNHVGISFGDGTGPNLAEANDFDGQIYDLSIYSHAFDDGGISVGQTVTDTNSDFYKSWKSIANSTFKIQNSTFGATTVNAIDGTNATFMLDRGVLLKSDGSAATSGTDVTTYVNGAQTTTSSIYAGTFARLSGALTDQATTLTVTSIGNSSAINPTGGYLYIGNPGANRRREKIHYTAYNSGTFTLDARGIAGTAATNFATNTIVEVAGSVTLAAAPASGSAIYIKYNYAGDAVDRSRSLSPSPDTSTITFLDETFDPTTGWGAGKLANSISTTGLVGYWKMDGSWTDQVGTNNLNTGSTSYVTGVMGQAGSGIMYSTTATNIPAANGTYTMGGWIYYQVPQYFFGVATSYYVTTNGGGACVSGSLTSGNWGAMYLNTSGQWMCLDSGVAAASGWSYIAIQSDTTTLSIYVNGILTASRAVTSPATGASTAVYPTNSAVSTGYTDDVAIWNRALTRDEITALSTRGALATSIAAQTAVGSFYGTDATQLFTPDRVSGGVSQITIDEGTADERRILLDQNTDGSAKTAKSLATGLSDGWHTYRFVAGVNKTNSGSNRYTTWDALHVNGSQPLLLSASSSSLVPDTTLPDLTEKDATTSSIASGTSANATNDVYVYDTTTEGTVAANTTRTASVDFTNQSDYSLQDSTKQQVSGGAASLKSPYTTSTLYTTTTTNTTQLNTTNWSKLSSVTPSEILAGQTSYYALSFDGRTTWKVWDSTASVWRSIAQNNAGTWQYNSSTASGTTVWTNASTNAQENAISQAFGVGSVNQMTSAQLKALTNVELQGTGGFTPGTTTTINTAVALSTSLTSSTPSVDAVTFTYDGSPYTLTSTINASVTSLSLTSTDTAAITTLPDSGIITIENEKIAYDSISKSTNTAVLESLTRGYLNTTAASHTAAVSATILDATSWRTNSDASWYKAAKKYKLSSRVATPSPTLIATTLSSRASTLSSRAQSRDPSVALRSSRDDNGIDKNTNSLVAYTGNQFIYDQTVSRSGSKISLGNSAGRFWHQDRRVIPEDRRVIPEDRRVIFEKGRIWFDGGHGGSESTLASAGSLSRSILQTLDRYIGSRGKDQGSREEIGAQSTLITNTASVIQNLKFKIQNSFAIPTAEAGVWNYLFDDAAFPVQATIIASDTALTVLDAANDRTWMTFTVGTGNAIPSRVRAVTASDGAIYAGTESGTIKLDFKNDQITKIVGTNFYTAQLSTGGQPTFSDANSGNFYYSDTTSLNSSATKARYTFDSFQDDGRVTDGSGNTNHLSANPVGAAWRQVTGAAGWSARIGFATLNYNNKMWVLGGANSSNDVWSSSDGVTWTQVTASAAWGGRGYLTALVFNNKMWVMGGRGGASTYYNDVWSSTDGATWTQVTAAAAWSVRGWQNSLVYDNKMWIMAGYNGSTALNDVWYSSDGSTWTQATASAGWPVRHAASAVVYNGKMWMIAAGGPLNDVWSSTDGVTWTNVLANTASPGANQFSQRHQQSVVVFANKMWLTGGYNGSYLADVWSSTDGVTWVQATSSAAFPIRSYHNTLVFNNKLWVIGGNNVSSNLSDVWVSSTPTFTADGVSGRAAEFSGNREVLKTPSTFSYLNSHSVGLWFQTNSCTAAQKLMSRWNSTTNNNDSFNLFLNTSCQIGYSNTTSGVYTPARDIYTSAIALGVWNHVVGTYDGVNNKIYLNGVLASSVAATGNLFASTLSVDIGGAEDNTGYFTGLIDEPFIASRTFSAGEIRDLYEAGLASLRAGKITSIAKSTIGAATYVAAGTKNRQTVNQSKVYVVNTKTSDVVSSDNLNPISKVHFDPSGNLYYASGTRIARVPVDTAAVNGAQIRNSLRFNGTNAYLSRTPSVAGNSKTWTWSGWVKRDNLAIIDRFFSAVIDDNNRINLGWYAGTDQLAVTTVSGGTSYIFLSSGAYRDPSTWYHCVISVDTAQANSNNRVRVYMNGVQLSMTGTPMPQNTNTAVNAAVGHSVGRNQLTASANGYTDGYLSDIYLIDGQALDPTFFGSFDSTGRWIPKKYAGTYGVNGFHLDFTDSSALGKDTSGMGNTWTVNNIATTDQMIDTPTNTFATLNPLHKKDLTSTATLTNGNLTTSCAANNAASQVYYSTIAIPDTMKLYVEATATTVGTYAGSYYPSLGIWDASGNRVFQWTYDGNVYVNDAWLGANASYAFTSGDNIGFAVDVATRNIWLRKNGTWLTGDPAAGTGAIGTISTTTLSRHVITSINATAAMTVNFGQGGQSGLNYYPDAGGYFRYAPPAGFKALSTANLPTPTIQNPKQYFDTKLYTGTGTAQNITGMQFQPDLIWAKSRSAATNHIIIDSIRGQGPSLNSNSTAAQLAGWGFSSFNSDGFTTAPANTDANNNGSTYVAWSWKRGATPGFDIMNFAYSSSAVSSLAHNLNAVPAFTIVKRTDNTGQWLVYHKGIASNAEDKVLYFDTSAAATINDLWANTIGGQGPTASNFYINSGMLANGQYIAYLWSEVPGFSKFGSYTGNGNADGPFVYTGFKPRYVLFKRTDTTSDWQILDTARSLVNPAPERLYPDLSNAEDAVSGNNVDILSNGFKLRTATGFNVSSGTYIYAAFADQTLKPSTSAYDPNGGVTTDTGSYATTVNALAADTTSTNLYAGTNNGVEKFTASTLTRSGSSPFLAQSSGTNNILAGSTNTVAALAIDSSTGDLAIGTSQRTQADTEDGYTKLLLHADGANGATTFVDSSGLNQSVTTTNATISTTQSKFGGSSANFNGTSAYLSVPDSPDFNMGSSDFTIDVLAYSSNVSTNAQVIGKRTGATWGGWLIMQNSNGTYGFFASSNGTSWDVALGQSLGTSPLNTWAHLVVVRKGTSFYLFNNGTQTASFTSSAVLYQNTDSVKVGSDGSGNFFSGYLDEVRITKGLARWTSAFTPPAAPYSPEVSYTAGSGALTVATTLSGTPTASYTYDTKTTGTDGLTDDRFVSLGWLPNYRANSTAWNYRRLIVGTAEGTNTVQIAVGAVNDPGNLQIYASDTTTIITNGSAGDKTVVLKPSILHADTNKRLTVFINLTSGTLSSYATPLTTNADGLGNPACATTTTYTACTSKIWYAQSTLGDYTTTPYQPTITIPGLPEETSFKVQAIVSDSYPVAQTDTYPTNTMVALLPEHLSRREGIGYRV